MQVDKCKWGWVGPSDETWNQKEKQKKKKKKKKEGEAVATFDLRLLPRLEVTGELGRGEGLERVF